jgi:hypothetical protein
LSDQSTSSSIPEAQKCPRCGEYIFLGETECSRCGYNVASVEQRLRGLNPVPISATLIALGVMFAFVSFAFENNMRFAVFLLGSAGIIGGGLVYAADMIFNNPMRKRK